MMEKTKLRGADFITSVILIIFGALVLVLAFQMPMKDSWGGVMNVWFVSPALFPLFIGGGIILLAVNILVHALNHGGLRAFKEMMKNRKIGLSESGVRFLAILVPLLSLVYMNLPRIDFFIDILLFLTFFITVFYIDDMRILKNLLVFYSAEMGLLLVLFASGFGSLLSAVSPYIVDVIGLVLFVLLFVAIRRAVSGNRDYRGKFRHALIMSFLTPLVLVPTFRFFLRVPLPKEGGIVDLMSLAYYALR